MIIIAGATGYIGKYLSVELTKKGREVLALGRNPKSAEFLRSQGVPFMEFDLLNDADYEKLPTENIEAIVNLAVDRTGRRESFKPPGQRGQRAGDPPHDQRNRADQQREQQQGLPDERGHQRGIAAGHRNAHE